MDPLHKTYETISFYSHRLQSNISSSVSTLSLRDYIRLISIVGAYCLLRPYLLRLAGRFQAKDHERELDPDEMSSAAATRGKSALLGVEVPGESSDDDDDEDGEGTKSTSAGRRATGADWGRGARRRQRAVLKKLLAEEEERKREEEEGREDRDIEEFLVKE